MIRTAPGRIIIMAGGTGIFHFSDFIDLVFKEHLLKENHELSQIIQQKISVLIDKPFFKFNFVLLLSIHETEDIHPTAPARKAEPYSFWDFLSSARESRKNPRKLCPEMEYLVRKQLFFKDLNLRSAKDELRDSEKPIERRFKS